MKMLKRIRPKIDPCGTKDNKTCKTLYVSESMRKQ